MSQNPGATPDLDSVLTYLRVATANAVEQIQSGIEAFERVTKEISDRRALRNMVDRMDGWNLGQRGE